MAFFEGVNQCPGRHLMAADGLLLLLEVLKRVDVVADAPINPMRPGLVNTFPGATRMTLGPAATLPYELHRDLLGVRPPPDAVPPPDAALAPARHTGAGSERPVVRPVAWAPYPLGH